jgi:Tol biopolymer transport system component/tRNA A-37 threonylcarbamoyl transferase component Bud32
MIGTILGHYRITEKLGEGGMGVVYKAQDLHLDRSVALKVLPPERFADPERKQRFTLEAKSASALNHPNIVTIHDIASDAGVDFIAMEYVPGTTLDRLIPGKGMRLNDALKIAVQVADALAAAHAIGIIHRDVKPSNIMVSDQGRVKVMDFGLVKLKGLVAPAAASATATVTAIRTAEGRIVGTLHYMSPEQAQGRDIDERSDVFSFGSMLYEMVSGRRPFQGDSAVTTLAAVIEKEPPPLTGEIPAGVEKVVTRCLRKDPSRRYQHMADVRVELQELVEESDSKQRPARARAGTKRRARWIAAAAVSVLVLAAAAWFVFFRAERALPPARLLQLTSYPGIEDAAALSPDGKQVAFSWNGPKEDNTDIYVQIVGETHALRLTTDPRDDLNPCWSPDGTRIAFRRRGANPATATIVLVSPLGGPEQQLREVPGLPTMATGMSWSPDGRFLAVGLASSASTPRIAPGVVPAGAPGIYLVPLAGGELRRITWPQAAESDWFGQFSPDGRALAFSRVKLAQMVSDLYVQPLAKDYGPAGPPRQVTHDRAGRPGLAWTPDGKAIVYSAQVGFLLTHLYRILADGNQPPERIELAGLRAARPAISKNRLAFSRDLADADVWRFRLGGAPEPLIRSSFSEWAPQFSPDGRKVAFNSNRNGDSSEIWVADADGSNPWQLTHGPGRNQGTARWSEDGRQIAFDSQDTDGRADIFTIDSAGGQPRRFTSAASNEAQPSWSRDSRWVYFQSDRTGRFEIWRCPFPDGTVEQWQQMTTGGGDTAFESSDGGTLYYRDLAGGLYAKRLGGGSDEKLIDKVTLGFGVLEKGIVYGGTVGTDGKIPLLFYEFSSRSSRALARIAARGAWNGSFTVSPDGTTFLYSASLSSGQDLMLIENFR